VSLMRWSTQWQKVNCGVTMFAAVSVPTRSLRVSNLRRAVFVLGALLGACAAGPDDPYHPDNGQYPQLTSSQRIVIGGADAAGPSAFGNVAAGALYRDSLLAIADGMSREIHIFGLDGELTESRAGAGAGPGMARTIRFVAFASDGGLCMWDQQLSRITRWHVDGSVIKTWRPEHPGFDIMESTLIGLANDCSSALFRDRIRPALVHEVGGTNRGMIQFVDTVVINVVDEEQRARTLTRQAAPPVWLMRSEGLNSVHGVILGERLEAVLVGTTLWYATTDSLRWSRIDIDGNPLDPVRLPTHRRRANIQDIENARARHSKDVRTVGPIADLVGEAQVRAYVAAHNQGVEQVPASEFLPAFDLMVAGSDETLWVRVPAAFPSGEEDWLLLDAAAVPLGRLTLPAGGEPVAGSSRILVMRHRDAFDAEFVRVLDIRQSADDRGEGPH
jgi:hypothetical protein